MTDATSVQCVYTIVNHAVVEKALANGGVGEFDEGNRWVSASRVWEELGPEEIYPLLLANAASIEGVEWVAKVDSLEIDGKKTRVKFSCLLECAEPIALSELTKTSDGQPLDPNYIRPYVPCVLTGELANDVLLALEDERDGHDAAMPSMYLKTADDYVAALQSIGSKITENQRAMLIAHAKAPGRVMSMQTLAEVAGYSGHRAANVQYGALGRKFADFFGVDDLSNQTQAIASSDGIPDASGHFAWTLREPLAQALQRLGWVEGGNELKLQLQAAARAVDEDPATRGCTATVRESLVEARIGQGAYRAKLMHLWDGRCALTGCDLADVLIASHAKPWADCNNAERLDEFNGLLLAAHVDKLFDRGLISFADDGRLLVQPTIREEALAQLGLTKDMQLRTVYPQNAPYLRAHRKKFGFV